MDEQILEILRQQLTELQEIRRKLDILIQTGGGGPQESPNRISEPVRKSSASGKILDTLLGHLTTRKEDRSGSPLPQPSRAIASPSPALLNELKEAIISVLFEAGTPMTFEKIFQKLQQEGASLPADRPKLYVRKLLYNPKLFRMVRGTFSLVEGIRPGVVLPADSAPVVSDAESAAPIEASKPYLLSFSDDISDDMAEVADPCATGEETPALSIPPSQDLSPTEPDFRAKPLRPSETQGQGSVIPPGHYTRTLEALLGSDATQPSSSEG